MEKEKSGDTKSSISAVNAIFSALKDIITVLGEMATGYETGQKIGNVAFDIYNTFNNTYNGK